MKTKPFVMIVVTMLLGGGVHAAATNPVNFVIVLADDLGYGDVGCYGNAAVKTPTIDALAREGLRLTSCYSAGANCSPSRAGLLTGRTPYRVGIYNWIAEDSPVHLRYSEVTVAELLKAAGYATAHVGKWHLNGGMDLPQPQPGDQGFEYSFGTQNNAEPSHENPVNFYKNGVPVGPLNGYSADHVVERAIDWLKHRDTQRPFLLYVAFHNPHEVIATPPEYLEMYDPDANRARAEYLGNITHMDAALGRLIAHLDASGLRNNTCVIFTSDNGPAKTRQHPDGSAGPLRDKKGSVYEGGIRVPGIVRFPGRIQPGMVSDEPVCGVDVLPTLCDIAGVSLPKKLVLDGVSFEPLFRRQPMPVRRRPLYWEAIFSHAAPKIAIRIGEWKLVGRFAGDKLGPTGDMTAEAMQAIKQAEPEGFELYNLRDDIGETRNLAGSQAPRLAVMVEELRRMQAEVRADGPVWPDWRRAKPPAAPGKKAGKAKQAD